MDNPSNHGAQSLFSRNAVLWDAGSLCRKNFPADLHEVRLRWIIDARMVPVMATVGGITN